MGLGWLFGKKPGPEEQEEQVEDTVRREVFRVEHEREEARRLRLKARSNLDALEESSSLSREAIEQIARVVRSQYQKPASPSSKLEQKRKEVSGTLDLTAGGEVAVVLAALREGSESELKTLLEQGADPNLPNEKGEVAIVLAAELGHWEKVKLLLKHKAEIGKPGLGGRTALIETVWRGNTAMAGFLLGKGADVNCNSDRGTPLIVANKTRIDKKGIKFIEKLLEAGADVNAQDPEGNTALMAMVKRDPKIVQLLLDHGADTGIRNKQGNTAQELADPKIAIKLQEWNQGAELRRIDGFIDHAIKENIAGLESALAAGHDINAKNEEEKTALSRAISKGKYKAVKFLIDHGADIKARLDDEQTLLELAAKNSTGKIIELLLGQGAGIESRDRRGYTSLMHAVDYGNLNAVRSLIKKGADAHARDNTGTEILYRPQRTDKNRREIEELLTAAGPEKPKQQ